MSNTVQPVCWDATLKMFAILEIDKGLYMCSALVEKTFAVVKRVFIRWKKFSDLQLCFLISALKWKLN